MSKQIHQIKRAIGAFLKARRLNMGWTPRALRNRTGTSDLQIEKIETGKDTVTMDTFLRVMLELGVGMHLTEQNSDAPAVSAEATTIPPHFLATLDPDARQLYVLHWRRPSFLVKVVQTIPHDLRFVATWGATPAEIKALPVWAEAESFVQKLMSTHDTSPN